MKILCSTGEIVYTYKEYLKTKHWRKRRMDFKNKFNNECEICKNTKNLHIHHMTYENIGFEKDSDLVFLCKDCHSFIHKNMDKLKEESYLQYMKRSIKKGKQLKQHYSTCTKCIHLKLDKKSNKRYCDINFDISLNKKKVCKRYCLNDYIINKSEKQQIKKHNKLIKEKKKNHIKINIDRTKEIESITDNGVSNNIYVLQARAKALKKKQLYK